MAPRSITIVGASLAGLRIAQGLRRRGFDGPVELIGEESTTAYYRPSLSKEFLTRPGSQPLTLPLLAAEDCALTLGTTAVGLDLQRRRLTLRPSGGGPHRSHPFDGLAIATGASPRTLPMPTPEGVHTVRSLADARRLRDHLHNGPRVVIVGAGLIGGEVAASCRALGLDVSVVDLGLPMARQLGDEVGAVMAQLHRDNGTALHLGATVVGFDGRPHVSGVRLSTGDVLPADLVVLGIGAAPATRWLVGSGIPLDDGVICEPDLSVRGAPRVVAAGDVVRRREPGSSVFRREEHWESADRHADLAAATLLGQPFARRSTEAAMYWSHQYDCRVQVVGRPEPRDVLTVREGCLNTRRFAATYGQGGEVHAALLLNMPHRLAAYRRAVNARSEHAFHDAATGVPGAAPPD